MQKYVNPIGEFIKADSSECLTVEQITGYTGGRIQPAERRVIELHITGCDLCAEALLGALVGGDHSADTLAVDRINEKFSGLPISGRKSPARLYYYVAAAAVAVIAIGLFFVLQRPDRDRVLFTSYFEPYPNTTPLVRGSGPVGKIENAMMVYELGQFDEASKILDDYITDHHAEIMPAFYQGVADLARGETRQAVSTLERVARSNDVHWAEPARWYLALAYVKVGDHDLARRQLNLLAGTENYFSDKASALLLQLH